MKLICKVVKSIDEAEAFIAVCESDFEKRLRAAAHNALSRGGRFITLSGPTCSGKTTTAAMLVDELSLAGRRAVVISIDDFYLDDLHFKTDNEGKLDFDSVKTIDLECLSRVVEALRKGESAEVPIFDFYSGRRSGYRTVVPEDNDVYIFEGIQAVYPEVTTLFGDRFTSVFICVYDDVMFNGVYFSASEIRLLRRIVRDSVSRNTSPAETLAYWDNVRENEEENIFPNADNPHVCIDSFLMYELFVIAPIAYEKLLSVSATDSGYALANSLLLRLAKIDGTHFNSSLVPKDSLFREFVGSDM